MKALDRIMRSVHEVLKRGEIGSGSPQALRPDDHVVGEITDDRMKRLFTACQKLAIDMGKLSKLSRLHPEAKDDPTFAKRFFEIFRQFTIFNAIYADALNEEFDLYGKPWIGLRNGWTVVWNEEKKMARAIQQVKLSQSTPRGVRIPTTIIDKHREWSRIGSPKRKNPLELIN